MFSYWYLHQDVLEEIILNKDKINPSEIKAFFDDEERSSNKSKFKIIGSTAHVPITGMLTMKPSFFSFFSTSGNTCYGDIIAAISAANKNKSIKEIVLNITSPGGEVSGLAAAANAIFNSKKPVTANIIEFAYSAAYGLASQADKIIINNDFAMVGSVGVASQQYIEDAVKIIKSTDAPDKLPDASTEHGFDVIKKELDELHLKFVEIIARGRSKALDKSITHETVNENFGKGGRVMAEKALTNEMIDAIGENIASNQSSPDEGFISSSNKSKDRGKQKVNIDTLKTENPEVYAAIKQIGLDEGFKSGVDTERDRVMAHMTAGESCNALDLAAKCIKDGSAYSMQSVQAEYMAAGRKKDELDVHANDNPGSLDTPDTADTAAAEKNMLDLVMAKSDKSGKAISAEKI